GPSAARRCRAGESPYEAALAQRLRAHLQLAFGSVRARHRSCSRSQEVSWISLQKGAAPPFPTLLKRGKNASNRRRRLACGLPQVAQVDLYPYRPAHHLDQNPDAGLAVEILIEDSVYGGQRATLDQHRLARPELRLRQGQLSLRAGLEHKPIATPIDARTHPYENPPNSQPTAGDTPGPAIPRATADDSPIVRSRQPSQSDRSRIGPLSSKLGARSRPT